MRKERTSAGLNAHTGNPLKGRGTYVVWTTKAEKVLYECVKSKDPIYWRGSNRDCKAIAMRLNEDIKPQNKFDSGSVGDKLKNDKIRLEEMETGETRGEMRKRKRTERNEKLAPVFIANRRRGVAPCPD